MFFLDSVCLGDDVDLSKLNQFGQVTIYKQSNPEEVIERIKKQISLLRINVYLPKKSYNMLRK